MVKFRNLDKDGDFTFGYNLTNYLIANNAIGLDIKTALLEWKNDCFFALLNGIDWKNRIGFSQKANLDSDIQNIILNRYGVVGFNSFYSNLVGRNYIANYDIQTIYSKSFVDTFLAQ